MPSWKPGFRDRCGRRGRILTDDGRACEVKGETRTKRSKSKPFQFYLFSWTLGFRGRAVELVLGADMLMRMDLRMGSLAFLRVAQAMQ